jgi:hypothetical protein
MKVSLDEFIKIGEQQKQARLYVQEPGFEFLYVRYGRRYIFKEDRPYVVKPVLDIANVAVEESKRGTGIFTARLAKLREDHPGLHVLVEEAQPRFGDFLLRLGFIPQPVNNFFLEAKDISVSELYEPVG